MKKIGVVLLVLGLLCFSCFPLAGLAEKAGTQTTESEGDSLTQEDAKTKDRGQSGTASDNSAFPKMDFEPRAASAVLMDASTGTVLYEMNSHEQREPASVTKIMTMALVMEEIKEERLSFEDIVTASENAKNMGGSQIYLDTGEQMSVYDLLKSVALASANDSTLALAEHIGGSEEAFVKRMNEKAAELGMKNTHFINPHGLSEEGHYTSAYDIALMSRYLLSMEGIEDFIAAKTYAIREGEKEYLMANSNKLLQTYDGCIGIKTGFTDQAKYCLSAAAQRDGLRLIAVIMGADSIAVRNEDIAKMLDWGFAQFESYTITPEKITQSEVPVKVGMQDTVHFWVPQMEIPTQIIVRGHTPVVEQRVMLEESVRAPVAIGDTLGSVKIMMDGKVVYEHTMTAVENVAARDILASFWLLLRKIITF